jgi:hypothetical protein
MAAGERPPQEQAAKNAALRHHQATELESGTDWDARTLPCTCSRLGRGVTLRHGSAPAANFKPERRIANARSKDRAFAQTSLRA